MNQPLQCKIETLGKFGGWVTDSPKLLENWGAPWPQCQASLAQKRPQKLLHGGGTSEDFLWVGHSKANVGAWEPWARIAQI